MTAKYISVNNNINKFLCLGLRIKRNNNSSTKGPNITMLKNSTSVDEFESISCVFINVFKILIHIDKGIAINNK